MASRLALLIATIALAASVSWPVSAWAANAEPGSTATTVSKSLPAELPLRRDAQPQAGTSFAWPAAAFVLVAGFAGGWLLWRRGAWAGVAARALTRTRLSREQSAVRVSSQALTPHASVHVVRWRGVDLLVGCTAQEVTVLATDAAPTAREDSA